MTSFTPSAQQTTYFDWIKDGTGNAVLVAVAGAGKTTTLIRGLEFMRGTVQLCAFNKPIADEFAERIESLGLKRRGLFSGTMHSVGLYAMRRAYPNVQVDNNKISKLIERACHDDVDFVPVYECLQFVTKMIAFGKQFLAGIRFPVNDLEAWAKIVDHFGVDSDLPDKIKVDDAMLYVIHLFNMSLAQCREVIDFHDMIYAPLALNLHLFKNDWVAVDESQDLNPARQEMVRRMLKHSGRLVAVGDPCQAIFSFTGADSAALATIAKDFRCIEIPLTYSYRCPRAVVRYAQQWVSHIQAHPNAPEGVVRQGVFNPKNTKKDGKPWPWFCQDEPMPGDAVLCRYNKPLASTAFAMLRAGIACRIEGRDVGNGLIALATRWKVKTITGLRGRLETFRERETTKARKSKSVSREQDVNDRIDTVLLFADRCEEAGHTLIGALVVEISSMFADQAKDVVVLSSIHKSKGKEYNKVFWIEQPVRGQARMKDWELETERFLSYVAATRAKHELILVGKSAQQDDTSVHKGEIR
jgi:ATP-dependent DNA helicase UvrD/PcrA